MREMLATWRFVLAFPAGVMRASAARFIRPAWPSGASSNTPQAVFPAWRSMARFIRYETPDDFVFSVKGTRFIIHMKRVRDCEQALANAAANRTRRHASAPRAMFTATSTTTRRRMHHSMRAVRVVHEDSEHRPRPPGGERSRFVSRSLEERTNRLRPSGAREQCSQRHAPLACSGSCAPSTPTW
ncbi:hypothetical protein [Xanthomonas oryzae pv. oryzae MAFF 311018]|nr:hypothetical protein [Xanthomonas oryzae pv. oryzae MAFF 311018]